MFKSLESQVDSRDVNLLKRQLLFSTAVQINGEEFLSVCASYFVLREAGPSELGWGLHRAQVDVGTWEVSS